MSRAKSTDAAVREPAPQASATHPARRAVDERQGRREGMGRQKEGMPRRGLHEKVSGIRRGPRESRRMWELA
jgi:hypothetical protein